MQRMIDIALSEVGYLEKASTAQLDSKTGNAGSANFTKYWRDLYPKFQGQSWCNAFVNWCFTQAYGQELAKKLLFSTDGWSYYTPTSAGYFKKNNAWKTSNPSRGDIIYFKNSTRICHVGIVLNVKDGVVYTIEGNTSMAAGVVANGGGVNKKSYSIGNSRIAGYGVPNYSLVGGHMVTCDSLNVREGAGKEYKSVGILHKGDTVNILTTDNGWHKIGEGRWVSAKYIS